MIASAVFLFNIRRVRKNTWKSSTGMDDDVHLHCNCKVFVPGMLCFPRSASIPVILVANFCLTDVGRVKHTGDPQCKAMP